MTNTDISGTSSFIVMPEVDSHINNQIQDVLQLASIQNLACVMDKRTGV